MTGKPSEQPGRKKIPLTEEEQAARQKSRALAKKMVIIMAIALVALLGLNALSEMDFTPILDAILGTGQKPEIKFEIPNYEENIMKDSAYLNKTRLMGYKNGAQMTLINEEDYINYDATVNRMHDFFTVAIAGDLDGYNACFTEDYHKENDGKRTEPFTMQRIYDMLIEYMGVIKLDERGTVKRVYYLVEYKIQKNNGTFRNDVGSDGALPQVFELIWDTEAGEAYIEAVTPYGEFQGIPYDEDASI